MKLIKMKILMKILKLVSLIISIVGLVGLFPLYHYFNPVTIDPDVLKFSWGDSKQNYSFEVINNNIFRKPLYNIWVSVNIGKINPDHVEIEPVNDEKEYEFFSKIGSNSIGLQQEEFLNVVCPNGTNVKMFKIASLHDKRVFNIQANIDTNLIFFVEEYSKQQIPVEISKERNEKINYFNTPDRFPKSCKIEEKE